MFFNEVEVKQNQRDIVKDGHHLFNFEKGVDHTVFVLIFIPFFIFFSKIFELMFKCLKSLDLHNKVDKVEEKDFDENLGTYWECIIG